MTNEAAERLRQQIGNVGLRGTYRSEDTTFWSLLNDALAAERTATVILMENEGVVTWGDDRHRERFLDAEAAR